MEYSSYLEGIVISYSESACEVKSRISTAKAAFSKKEDSFLQQIGLNYKEEMT
jgi:hypothetical protein